MFVSTSALIAFAAIAVPTALTQSTQSSVSYNNTYDSGSDSMSTVVCSDRSNGLASKWPTFANVPISCLSVHWWDEHSKYALLHCMNPAHIHFICNEILKTAWINTCNNTHNNTANAVVDVHAPSRQALQGMDVLDIGCGRGLLSESLASLGASMLGINTSESNIHIASLHTQACSDGKEEELKHSCGCAQPKCLA
ncbi:hypothetical protein CONPUDRAFT_71002 [Coniophora puteana RWD-64-598 SS2]|uniref:Methyltransferase type 11 domain-containing protein n=1 Tax=Coniophora puteana (strain RWD-64-598) TaxID=741705 RepID=A0A5M3MZV2_CONPW|nr:uncharacterized protein CONPUDRAFT_71002 [Coniophora puteana RWD-64-598 SS2]EIW84161.1 hypothetical protein CONPUDRAFT_71002 [Coniophora puteana RWD-64-598 SS2]